MFTRASIIAALVATASAFTAPALPTMGARKAAVSTMQMQDKSYAMPFLSRPPALDGSMAGDVGFDPLGFSNYFDLKWLREAELKHGRVCMLGVVGFLAQEFVTLPQFENGVTPVDDFFVVPAPGLWQIFFTIGFVEAFSNGFKLTPGDMFAEGRAPGDLGFDPLGCGKNPEALARRQLVEVKNGRLAMIAIGGMTHHYFLTGKGPVQFITQIPNFRSCVARASELPGAKTASLPFFGKTLEVASNLCVN
mmetsp:Transcript_32578/g.83309  ORF Transcript_32578/g.83309 Transcript_32578/m.83309 type:complete len:250 (-) Transcript_32578:78-827(-)